MKKNIKKNNEKSSDPLSDDAMITYAHKSDPYGHRFSQYAKDRIPDWAIDVQPYLPNEL